MVCVFFDWRREEYAMLQVCFRDSVLFGSVPSLSPSFAVAVTLAFLDFSLVGLLRPMIETQNHALFFVEAAFFLV